jgi:hypothetical protein
MSETTSLPVRVGITVTVEIDGHATVTELVAVAMPSTAGIDEITAAGFEMLAARINADELSIPTA